MRRLIFRLFIGLLSFAVVLSVASWFFLSHSQVAKPPQTTIPDGWKKIELKAFSFYAPPDMKNQNVRGIDSAVWEFRNRRMTVNLDYGMYSDDLEFHKDQPEYRTEWLRIDGKKAKVATLRMSNNYIAAIYFPEVSDGGGTKLTFWASCVDSAMQESAKKIFLSIKFR
jgi:hypothetical protein